ncbi:ChaC-domain-containing protein [Lindgomyces ingoldianus]|uniref:ChaC-domain-containing protein n=1 Tax=Lindgomyces ingoldianus TaxID=673940 RepID=A0ACB6QND0_9PLEO|nr:ChaC-domain-containing protein [Lindgomyces ingoldianus]KAF2468083.1 ChaC-domain-containing protein [Lindgomyces ingoldianus]
MADHEKQIEGFGKDDDFWLFGYGQVFPLASLGSHAQKLIRWIAYRSLIWKPPPHYDQRIPGYIEGYVRRFWQTLVLSEDHRGTPEAPGRVVTLIDRAHWETLTDHHASTERVWGAAYHIPSSKVAEVRSYLDIREINGYSIQFTPFHPAPFIVSISSPPSIPAPTPTTQGHTYNHKPTSSITAHTEIFARPLSTPSPIICLVYIGLPSNPQFLGPQDPDTLARHILKSKGPSGENKEYLYLLERSLLELGVDSGDRHVSDLVRRCKDIESAYLSEGMEGIDAKADSGDGGTEETGETREKAGEVIGERLHKVGSTEEQEEVEK